MFYVFMIIICINYQESGLVMLCPVLPSSEWCKTKNSVHINFVRSSAVITT